MENSTTHPEGADPIYPADVRRGSDFRSPWPPSDIRKRAAPKPNPPVHTYRTCIDPWAVTRFPRRNATQAFLVPFSYRPYLGRATLTAPRSFRSKLNVPRPAPRAPSSICLRQPPPCPSRQRTETVFRDGSLARLDPSRLYTLFMRRIFLLAPKLSTARRWYRWTRIDRVYRTVDVCDGAAFGMACREILMGRSWMRFFFFFLFFLKGKN